MIFFNTNDHAKKLKWNLIKKVKRDLSRWLLKGLDQGLVVLMDQIILKNVIVACISSWWKSEPKVLK